MPAPDQNRAKPSQARSTYIISDQDDVKSINRLKGDTGKRTKSDSTVYPSRDEKVPPEKTPMPCGYGSRMVLNEHSEKRYQPEPPLR